MITVLKTHGEEDDDPGAGVVVLAAAVDQADGVQQGREERPHVGEVSRLKSLQGWHRLKTNEWQDLQSEKLLTKSHKLLLLTSETWFIYMVTLFSK